MVDQIYWLPLTLLPEDWVRETGGRGWLVQKGENGNVKQGTEAEGGKIYIEICI